jgi:hypothetical protein
MGDFKAPIGWYINQKRYMYVNCQQLNHSPAQKKKGGRNGLVYSSTVAAAVGNETCKL